MTNKSVSFVMTLKSKSDKELLILITGISGLILFMVMDINNIVSVRNFISFILCLLISFTAYLSLKKYLRRK